MSYRFVTTSVVLWVDTLARTIKNKNGKHEGYVVVTQGVTERQIAAESMRRAKDAAQGGEPCGSQHLTAV